VTLFIEWHEWHVAYKKDLCYLQPQIVFHNKWMKKTEGKWLMQDKLKNDK